MQIKRVSYSTKFLRNLRKLPAELRPLLDERMEIFKAECFDPRLKTHKLKGRWQNCWSFLINYSYRVVFEFNGSSEAGFIDVGSHQVYQ